MSVTDFSGLLRLLSGAGVQYILIGGVAATSHGSARATFDLDIVYRRSPDNLVRLVNALAPIKPYLRGAPPGLPFRWDVETLQAGLNFTLVTSLGDLDILGEVVGGGTYEELFPHTEPLKIFSTECLRVDLDTLIRLKRAAGRPRDLDAIAELEALREEKEGAN